MNEENHSTFPLPNKSELFWIYAKTEIEETGIVVHGETIDDTITTDREVPEDIKKRIREHAVDKGIEVKFEVSKTSELDP